MRTNKDTHQNEIELYRRRMGFSLEDVARLMGHHDSSAVQKYERGHRLPSLKNAFRLGIVLRVPVEFLFPAEYDALRKHIRTTEEAAGGLAKLTQQEGDHDEHP